MTNRTGSVLQELSYDAWGRLRDPITKVVYTPGSEPELYLGRGYCGHEQLAQFGLINMNARLYDPVIGRFLSPDPYIQAPDYSQNFNRYSYCLNNPMKYTDPDGELWEIILAIWLLTSDEGYELQKAISPIAFHLDFHFSRELKTIGMDYSVGMPQLFKGNRYEAGAGYYWTDYNNSYSGWELRYGKEYSSGWDVAYYKFSHMHYDREGTEFDQDRDKITLGLIPGLCYMEFENDANMHDIFNTPGMPKHKTSDKYKTAEVRFHLMGIFEVGLTDFTGNSKHYDVNEGVGPNGTYSDNEYSRGILYLKVGPFKMGYHSETIRDETQNWFHDLSFIHSPRFPVNRRKFPNKFYWEFGF